MKEIHVRNERKRRNRWYQVLLWWDRTTKPLLMSCMSCKTVNRDWKVNQLTLK